MVAVPVPSESAMLLRSYIAQVVLGYIGAQEFENCRDGFKRINMFCLRGERKCMVADICADIENNGFRNLRVAAAETQGSLSHRARCAILSPT